MMVTNLIEVFQRHSTLITVGMIAASCVSAGMLILLITGRLFSRTIGQVYDVTTDTLDPIDTVKLTRSQNQKQVLYDFIVDNVSYSGKSSTCVDYMIGDLVNLNYNPDNPNDVSIVEVDYMVMSQLLIGLGTVLMSVHLIWLWFLRHSR